MFSMVLRSKDVCEGARTVTPQNIGVSSQRVNQSWNIGLLLLLLLELGEKYLKSYSLLSIMQSQLLFYYMLLRGEKSQAKVMDQWLRVLDALAKELNLVPSIHTA